jgi:hypothetical protein
MADTNTEHLSLIKPEVGGAENTWGTSLNSNMDTIDAAIYGKAPTSHDHDKTVYFSDWDNGVTYAINDFALYGGKIYKSILGTNLNKTPSTEVTYWTEFTSGGSSDKTVYFADWDSGITYGINDFVLLGGKMYKAILGTNLNKSPDVEPTYWIEFTSGGSTTVIGDALASNLNTAKALMTTQSSMAPGIQVFSDMAVDSLNSNSNLSNSINGIYDATNDVLRNGDVYTKALLFCEGVDSGAVFTDASGKTWTKNGDAKISSTEKKFGSSSMYFDGTGDWIDTPDHTDFTLGAGDFTIQCWVKRAVDGATHTISGQTSSGATGSSFVLRLEPTNRILFGFRVSTVDKLLYTSNVVTAAMGWTHIAAVRYGNTAKVYINGVADPVTYDCTGLTIDDSASKVGVGRMGEYASDYFNGYIDNFEFAKGIARYTSNFTPGQATLDSYTKVLLDGEGITYSTTLTDESGKAWTRYGDAILSTSQYKFGSSSMYFDGTGDYFDTPAHADFAFGPNNFTMEGYFRFDDNNVERILFSQMNGTTSRSFIFRYNGTGNLQFYYSSDGTNDSMLQVTWTPVINTWYHISLVRSSTSLYFFIDGSQVGSTGNISTTSIYTSTGTFKVGNANTGSQQYFKGYIDCVRISNTARYIGTFTPVDYSTTIIFNPITLTSTPSYGYVVVDETLGYGTIVYYLSRDGGTTYTLCVKDTLTSLTSQPSGVSLVLKAIITGNSILKSYTVGWRPANVASQALTIERFQTSLNTAKSLISVQDNVVSGIQLYSDMAMDALNSNTNIVSGGMYDATGDQLRNGDPFTKSLLFCEGVNSGAVFTDESGKTWTKYGTACISSVQKKYGSSSAFFDGNSDYADSPDHADWDLGTGDFTLEAWVYVASLSGYQMIWDRYNGAAYNWQCGLNAGAPYFYIRNGTGDGSVVNFNSSTLLTINTWTHIEFTRESGVIKAWVNGASAGSVAANYTLDSALPMIIGKQYNGSNYFNGYMDQMRFSKGIARHTSTFTPTQVTSDSYTKALFFCEGITYSTTLTDETGKTWTANGDAKIINTNYKYGTSSMYFDGTGDYFDTPDHADFDLGSGNFTIQFWVKKVTDGVTYHLCGQMDNAGNYASRSFDCYISTSNKSVCLFGQPSSALTCTSTGSITVAMGWTHIAFVRNGNTITQYINGSVDGTLDVTGVTINNSAYKMAIGRTGEYPSEYFNGYIDSFEFVKGIARYTGTFTPAEHTQTVIFSPVTLISVPKYAYVVVDENLGYGSIIYSVSRDGGTTYTVLTKDTLTDISGQPSGTTLILKVVISGNSILKAYVLGWRIGDLGNQDIGSLYASATYQSLPAADDKFPYTDVSDSNLLKTLSFTDLKSFIWNNIGTNGLGITGTADFNPSNLNPGEEEQATVTVTGANVGDIVVASFSVPGLRLYPEVTSINIVTVTFFNATNVAVNLSNGTIKVAVFTFLPSQNSLETQIFNLQLNQAKALFTVQAGMASNTQQLANMAIDSLNSSAGISSGGIYDGTNKVVRNGDSYTKSLLFGEGADASTVFTDETDKVWTKYGDARIRTADKKYGNSSMYFDGTGDYIDTPDHADFTLGAGDFTIQCWIKKLVDGTTQTIIGQAPSGAASVSYVFRIEPNNKVAFISRASNVDKLLYSANVVTVAMGWTHVAAVRYGNTVKIYINGVADPITYDYTGLTIDDNTYKVAIGRFGEYAQDYFNGYIDSFEFVKGIARYTANFTPTDLINTVIWNMVTASAVPTYAYIVADETLGYGSIVYLISRDNGTTYTTCTKDTLTSISAQPSGTSMILKAVITGNSVLNAVAWGWK